jgi:hypothetical protein
MRTLLLLSLAACTGAKPDDTSGADTGDTGADTDSGDTGTDSGDTDTGGSLPEPLTDGFAALLTYDVGCADVSLYAYAPDGTVVLRFYVDGAATAAHDAGGPVSFTWDLPSDAADAPNLDVRQGTDLDGPLCNDVIEDDPVELRRWVPVAGTATLSVEPTGERTDWGEVPSRADLVLTDMAFVPQDAPDSAPVSLGSITITSGVGWMPG